MSAGGHQTADGGDDKKYWESICDANGIAFFRVRTFVGDSKEKPHDPNGCLCSEWCIQKGFIASSSRSIPADMLSNPNEAKNFLMQSSDTVMEKCRQSKHFAGNLETKGSLRRYCNSYRYFAGAEEDDGVKHRGIREGDVVAMLVPGRQKTVDRETYFGVVVSNDLILYSEKKAMDNGFPARKLFEMEIFNGLMLRKVRWLRKCKTTELLSQLGTKGHWLVEASPFWFHRCSKALCVVETAEFREATATA